MKLDSGFFEKVKYTNRYDVKHFRTFDNEVLYVWEKHSTNEDPVIELVMVDDEVFMTGRYFDQYDYDDFIYNIEKDCIPDPFW
ncbi:hypothetical protein 65p151 [Aeromonas phage 65]|uniref:Uncharacterized protein n=2 Tax=Ishigurovirus osborne TaxID=260149 RepID=A0A219YC68_9CAUD|nr:hypothetical protein ST65p151 [Aeromonas phage 65]ADQ53159.1 hypothetical protein 65p151 [Aeromonas phage 65]APU01537.1 hypothetical protein [Aeromonas phage 65.2]UYD59268.1 hypothetical protein HPMBJEAJ_00153 [Aeromonas phage avDM6]